jgi:uncharacterized repeat protein (TIGR01451 family)
VQSPLQASAAGLVVQQGVSAQTLAETLVGTGVSVSNASYTGASAASGTFSGGAGILGFDSGVVMTSGAASNVIGPNTSDSAGTNNGEESGDTDLNNLLGSNATSNAAVLNFDFTPTASPISFEYVFASDEYNEFVYRGFNDVFGFFVTRGSTTTKVNCAVVSSGQSMQPVSVDTINGGNPFGNANASNPSLFRNNDLQDDGGSIDTEMDGLTTVLNCQADVAVGLTNHLKLAIADSGDSILDSAVFLKQNSLSTTHADVSITKTDGDPGTGPDPVSSGGTVAYRLSAHNAGPEAATGVVVTDTPDVGTVTGASGSGWTCSTTPSAATCTLDAPLAGGADAAPITVFVKAPTVSTNTTINDVAMISANESDPNTSNNQDTESTEVRGGAGTKDFGSSFCAGGATTCSITTDTGTGATRTDPTVSTITIPGGSGAAPQIITMNELASPPTFCGGMRCSGQVLQFNSDASKTFLGVTDPNHPAQVIMIFDKSVKGGSQIYVQKGTAAPTLVAQCTTPGIASPHPCVSAKNIVLPNGDREFIILFLQDDPTIGKK